MKKTLIFSIFIMIGILLSACGASISDPEDLMGSWIQEVDEQSNMNEMKLTFNADGTGEIFDLSLDVLVYELEWKHLEGDEIWVHFANVRLGGEHEGNVSFRVNGNQLIFTQYLLGLEPNVTRYIRWEE